MNRSTEPLALRARCLTDEGAGADADASVMVNDGFPRVEFCDDRGKERCHARRILWSRSTHKISSTARLYPPCTDHPGITTRACGGG